jgi:hypothetical protein
MTTGPTLAGRPRPKPNVPNGWGRLVVLAAGFVAPMYVLVITVPPGRTHHPWWAWLLLLVMLTTTAISCVWVARMLAHTFDPATPRRESWARDYLSVAGLASAVILAVTVPPSLHVSQRNSLLLFMTILFGGIGLTSICARVMNRS